MSLVIITQESNNAQNFYLYCRDERDNVRLSPVASNYNKRNAELFGFALQICSINPRRQEWSIGRLSALIIPAVYHEKIRFFFNHDGIPIGYIVWAFPSPEIQNLLFHEPNYVLHESEWDEDGSLLILDFVAQPEHIFSILGELRRSTFAAFKSVSFAQLNSKTNTRRMVTWTIKK